MNILEKDEIIKPLLAGIFCSDEIQSPLIKNKIWCLNASIHSEEGTHWFIIHTLNKDTVEYLCSAGNNFESMPHVAKAIKETGRPVYKFPRPVQIDWSSSCGNFTIWHIYLISRKVYGKEIYDRFYYPNHPSDRYLNDILVSEAVEVLFHLPLGQSHRLILDLDFIRGQIKGIKSRNEQRKKRRKKKK